MPGRQWASRQHEEHDPDHERGTARHAPGASRTALAAMTADQAVTFAIVIATVAMFAWGKLSYDLVAMLALLAGLVTGVVPADRAFAGFSDNIVVIIGAAMIVSAAIDRSGIVEMLMRPLLQRLHTQQAQVPALVGATALLSLLTKNVGALAVFMPVALQLARRTGTSASAMLMPMSFAALLGGIVTLVGTSPNIIVSQLRREYTGHAFGMFDFSPVGLGIAVLGCLFLSFGYRLLPRDRRGAAAIDAAFPTGGYMVEALLPADNPLVGQKLPALEQLAGSEVTLAAVVRERFRRLAPTASLTLHPDDVLLLEGEPAELERFMARARLRMENAGEKGEPTSVIEGVVTANSPLVGRTPSQAGLGGRYNAALIAVSRAGERIIQRLAALRFRPGDVLVLRGESAALPDVLGELRVLPLAERQIELGQARRSWIPALVLLAVMLVVAFHLAAVSVAFFAAAVVLLLLRVLTPEEAYETVPWHVIFLIATLIPLSEAVRRTGGTDLIAAALSGLTQHLPPIGVMAVFLVTAMVITPFLSNAPSVLMLGPIAGAVAHRLHLSVDPFLMAVALGAACDFLTPIGHQCNTLVMGPGGYRFGDYARLGLPLSILVVVLGVPLIAYFWPLSGH